jgi:hypothetical protein
MHSNRYLSLKELTLCCLIIVSTSVFAKDTRMEKTASAAFAAFGVGEKTGDYSGFKALISQSFALYSHPVQPMRGVFTGAIALEKMNELIAQRGKTPNALLFSKVKRLCSGDTCIFQFDSEGLVAGRFPYKGYNTIALTVIDGKITGFREYLGDVEPAWFQKM